jgi:hypothetical protein
MARKVDVSLLAQLNAGAEKQEVKKGGFSRTTDPNFPVFSTPINKDILVYIPMTNVVQTENGSDMKLLNVHTHTYREGNITGMLRCISGLEGGVFSEALGYDGTCPACEAVKDCWALYNRKLDAEAKKLGIDPQNDTGDVLKATRRKILDEMDMKGTEEYVTFPIVIIPTQEGSIKPAPDALKNLQVQFVVWTKKRYEKNIIGALDSLMENPGHPGGMFWVWKFSYDTGGKQANARDSAKNAKYMPITDGNFLNVLNPAKATLDKAAADFTNEKATEVIISNQFMYKEDLEDRVNKIMAKTRNLLSLSETESLGAPALGANPLASFGALPDGKAPAGDFGLTFGE